MNITIAEYRRGIASLHNLMSLLQAVLLEVMPSAELARTGAHGWRGYVIRSYKDLACGHYFCQIYLREPTTMLMEEFYNYSGFYYPWRVDFDLAKSVFFEKDVNGQKAILVSFYREAVAQSLEWQNSAKRHDVVPKKLWDGKIYQTSANLDYPKAIYHVSRDYVAALGYQDKLLAQVNEVVSELAPQLRLSKPYTKYNQSGWKYRGLWMKLRMGEPEDVIPKGSFPYMFKVDLYDNPTWLRLIGPGKEVILDLEAQSYFSLDKEHQRKTVSEFLWPILKQIKQDTIDA